MSVPGTNGCALKMVKMVDLRLCVFHNKKKLKEEITPRFFD